MRILMKNVIFLYDFFLKRYYSCSKFSCNSAL